MLPAPPAGRRSGAEGFCNKGKDKHWPRDGVGTRTLTINKSKGTKCMWGGVVGGWGGIVCARSSWSTLSLGCLSYQEPGACPDWDQKAEGNS